MIFYCRFTLRHYGNGVRGASSTTVMVFAVPLAENDPTVVYDKMLGYLFCEEGSASHKGSGER